MNETAPRPEKAVEVPHTLQRVGQVAPYLLWAILVVGTLQLRPPTAPLELEILGSAWHMWSDGVWYPLRNEIMAPQIPPAQLWLILGGWKLFGVVEWWPRLLSPIAALVTLWLFGPTARALWPHRQNTVYFGRILLIGLGGFVISLTMIVPEMLVLPLTLAGFALMARLWSLPPKHGQTFLHLAALILLQIAIVMTGGWAAWLLLPLTGAFIPFIDRTRPRRNGRWWYHLFVFSFPAAAMAAIWLDTLHALDHWMAFGNGWLDLATEATRSEVWTLLFLPVVLYPWICWKTMWRALRRSLRDQIGIGLRLSAAYLLAAIISGLLSGWQLQGMLMVAGPLCLIGARLLATQEIKARDFHAVVPGFLALLIGLLFFLMNIIPTAHLDVVWRWFFGVPLPIWLGGIGLASGLTLLVAGYILAQISPRQQLLRTIQVALLPVLLMTCVNVEFPVSLVQFFDLTPVASRLKEMQEAGQPIAIYGPYRGEFDFQGRLLRAPDVVETPEDAWRWATQHPGGAILTYFDGSPIRLPALPIYRGVARDHWVAIWPSSAIAQSGGRVLRSSF